MSPSARAEASIKRDTTIVKIMDAVFPRTRRNRRRYREKKFIRYESISIRYAFVFLPFYLFNVISILFSFFFFSFLFLFNVTYEVSILAALNYSERKYQAWSQVPLSFSYRKKKNNNKNRLRVNEKRA